MRKIIILDRASNKPLCMLENAYNVNYIKKATNMWTGSFSLPGNDPKNAFCLPRNLVLIPDLTDSSYDQKSLLFSIAPMVQTINTTTECVYELEHAISTLFDDSIIGFKEIGNLGVYTKDVIKFILEQQTVKNWVLGECAYNHQFLYGWENENLLSALFSVPNVFYERDYYWEYDTTVHPWTIHLRKAENTNQYAIKYKKNIAGLTKTVDATNLATRLYCYGVGEGDNRLTIKTLNNGVEYLEAPTVVDYGVITRIWTDNRYTIEQSLLSAGRALLAELSKPAVTYEVETSLYGQNLVHADIGDLVVVHLDGDETPKIIHEITHTNALGNPYNATIKFGSATTELSESLAQLAERQRVSEQYSAGSESIFAASNGENADTNTPYEIVIFIPENTKHVNNINCTIKQSSYLIYGIPYGGGGANMPTNYISEQNYLLEIDDDPIATTMNIEDYEGDYTTSTTEDETVGIFNTISTKPTYLHTKNVPISSHMDSNTSMSYFGPYVHPEDPRGSFYTNYVLTWVGAVDTPFSTMSDGNITFDINGSRNSYQPANYYKSAGRDWFRCRIAPNSQTVDYKYTAMGQIELPPSLVPQGYPYIVYWGPTMSSHSALYDKMYATNDAIGNLTTPEFSISVGGGAHTHFSGDFKKVLMGHTHFYEYPNGRGSSFPYYNKTGDEPHTHYVDLEFELTFPGHNHVISNFVHDHEYTLEHFHEFTVNGHDHYTTLPNHVHQMKPGISKYDLHTQDPGFEVYLDDTLITTCAETQLQNFNLLPYFFTFANGELMKGEHTIRVKPKQPCRIDLSYQVVLYTNRVSV